MRVTYYEWDDGFMQALENQLGLMPLFNYLVVQQDGDVDETLRILRELQARGHLGADLDLGSFEQQLEEQNVVREADGRLALTPRGERQLRRDALEQIFRGLRRRGAGDHPVPHEGTGGEPLPETRPFAFGDAIDRIDFKRSIRNALQRGASDDIVLQEGDLEVHETEHRTSCATVLLLDISHSMVLYGEDRITPAKRVALALTELILTRYPKDSLDLVLFGDDARLVKLGELPYVNVGPYHTNTRAGLRLARRILSRRKHTNKQVIMITDGKPSCMDEDGQLYKNSFGLDPRIVNRTLDEAVILRKHRIPITTFMVARDPYLQSFVQKLTELNHGRAYFASLRHLDGYVMVDFIRNRRRPIG
ncbi:MAG: VWA domain-containing protein [Candidatus Krumholzibacteriia bacterium]